MVSAAVKSRMKPTIKKETQDLNVSVADVLAGLVESEDEDASVNEDEKANKGIGGKKKKVNEEVKEEVKGEPQLIPVNGGYICGIKGCEHTARSGGDMKRHWEVLDHGPGQYVCETCERELTRKDSLKRHQRNANACRKYLAEKAKTLNDSDASVDSVEL
ncbi:hypothetical protein SISSUDRAFT_1126865 [Sistotremastrum suecicum HHB10207 ss-3]|uniref:C2H2-type domain-containing protein n=1 Tax=Sistotremastrum suecicum HHB10207 ss-3 TaxID=1314776 RepID=A0A166FTH5_9AGAM|nr:hypothetical protein SISSUDRAFT_1126865 [Sistotremastrum suecicum HHB10207 ss-3]